MISRILIRSRTVNQLSCTNIFQSGIFQSGIVQSGIFQSGIFQSAVVQSAVVQSSVVQSCRVVFVLKADFFPLYSPSYVLCTKMLEMFAMHSGNRFCTIIFLEHSISSPHQANVWSDRYMHAARWFFYETMIFFWIDWCRNFEFLKFEFCSRRGWLAKVETRNQARNHFLIRSTFHVTKWLVKHTCQLISTRPLIRCLTFAN